MEEDLYSRFARKCKDIASKQLHHWKTDPSIQYMLEHETKANAELYVAQILDDGGMSLSDVQRIASCNDRFGNSQLHSFVDGSIRCSTSSLRYLKHAYDIMQLLRSKSVAKVQVVEIGGGYGGLCLIMQHLAAHFNVEISNYIIYDLPEVAQLQKYYLDQNRAAEIVSWGDSASCGGDIAERVQANSHLLITSNYCLSEIPESLRLQYIENVLKRAESVYMRWNWGDKGCLPPNLTIVPEIPDTSHGNGNTIITL